MVNKYYQKHKERLRKEARDIKSKKGREKNQNITEEEENRHEYNQEHKQKLS